MKICVTGNAGFIGFHLSLKLLKSNYQVVGIDNLNDYYDTSLKLERLKILKKYKNFSFKKINISDKKLFNFLKKKNIKCIINLAAQAGVRYSIEDPRKYFESNLDGFFNILEISRVLKIKHLIFASTSSVYGNNTKFPLLEDYNTDKPLSFYAATKKSNEILAYSYSNIYKLPITGLRFFTVYGPFGRPDMSLFKFTKNILKGNTLQLFNNGKHIRDFTYIDDVVEGIISAINKPSKKIVPFNIFNIGSNNPKKLKEFINIIEKNLFKKSKIKNLPLQLGDVVKTHASTYNAKKYLNYEPRVSIEEGIRQFIDWFRNYYKNDKIK